MSKVQPVLLGAVAVLAVAELFHGPLGRADAFKERVELRARRALDNNEMTQIQAHLAETPLRRTMILSGPADDFQRGQLVKLMEIIPGVDKAEWDPGSLPIEIKLPEGAAPANVLAPPAVAIPEGK